MRVKKIHCMNDQLVRLHVMGIMVATIITDYYHIIDGHHICTGRHRVSPRKMIKEYPIGWFEIE